MGNTEKTNLLDRRDIKYGRANGTFKNRLVDLGPHCNYIRITQIITPATQSKSGLLNWKVKIGLI